VYFLANFCPLAFPPNDHAQNYAKYNITIFDGIKVFLDAKVGQSWTQIILILNRWMISEVVGLEISGDKWGVGTLKVLA
jgi:hypothetical protein